MYTYVCMYMYTCIYICTDNKDPKGLWGKGVPPEFRDQDFELIKALSNVEKDIDTSQAQMVGFVQTYIHTSIIHTYI